MRIASDDYDLFFSGTPIMTFEHMEGLETWSRLEEFHGVFGPLSACRVFTQGLKEAISCAIRHAPIRILWPGKLCDPAEVDIAHGVQIVLAPGILAISSSYHPSEIIIA